MFDVSVDGISCYGDFIVHVNDHVLVAGMFEKSKVKARAVGCKFGYFPFKADYINYTTKDSKYLVDYARLNLCRGRDTFYYVLATNKDVGSKYLITTEADLYNDLYDLFMREYKLPLLKEWMPVLLNEAITKKYIYHPLYPVKMSSWDRTLCLHGRDVVLKNLSVYDLSALDAERFQKLVSYCLSKKLIRITAKEIPPLEFKSFDDYIATYGSSLVANIDKTIKPLVPLKGEVDGLALKHKRLYPQQAACVNGIKALMQNGVKYALAVEGMGCGKTIQAASVVESYFIEEWLKKHPEKSLVDAYQDNVISYRAIIMCPGHLVEKWKAEVEKEIPYAKGIILNDFKQLLEIRSAGPKRLGKVFYILSKDFCKLGSQYSPIPNMVRTKYPCASACVDCLENDRRIVYKKGRGKNAICPECGGKHFKAIPLTYMGKQDGLICPECGELLLNISNPDKQLKDGSDDERKYVLTPADFAQRTNSNCDCYLCGAQLWGVNAKPIDIGGEFSSWVARPSKWRKLSHFKNLHRKATDTAFVLKGHESEYLLSRGVSEYKYSESEYGPRKSAPSRFIRKYLNGYFDFCILDEVHKFEGAGTAQANAAHSLIQASNFTLGLTGTISNGSAASFYYLLFMLDPGRMVQKGYSWSTADFMKFCRTYGTIETVYEAEESAVYNTASRGKQMAAPKVKPGISPLLFVDFLLDRAVFLDITDLSKFLPPLYEKVVTCDLPMEPQCSYKGTLDVLKEVVHSKEGRGALTSILQFGLSYPDKPYGRKNIMSAYVADQILAAVDNYDEYIDNLLPKERELVSIVNQELSEGRNCFVYACYTGEAETNVTERYKSIIERHCNLKGRVQIIQAANPAPIKREEYIQKKASEGIRCFICNPKVVETGLDFCFTYKGAYYNYPTLIFTQISYEMSVIWQASRRHYRLNQKEECRTYYLAYENTLQTAALEIMAAKQVATSAIQGKFSSEGLAAMAKGVDTRTQLAAALSKNDMSDRKGLEDMFDALNAQNNASDDTFIDYVPPKTFFELLGVKEADIFDVSEHEQFNISDLFAGMSLDEEEPVVTENLGVVTEVVKKSVEINYFGDIFEQLMEIDEEEIKFIRQSLPQITTKNTKKKKTVAGQSSLFDIFGVA